LRKNNLHAPTIIKITNKKKVRDPKQRSKNSYKINKQIIKIKLNWLKILIRLINE